MSFWSTTPQRLANPGEVLRVAISSPSEAGGAVLVLVDDEPRSIGLDASGAGFARVQPRRSGLLLLTRSGEEPWPVWVGPGEPPTEMLGPDGALQIQATKAADPTEPRANLEGEFIQ